MAYGHYSHFFVYICSLYSVSESNMQIQENNRNEHK